MSCNTKFSIVFQGVFEPEYLNVILTAKKYSDDIILSTWNGCISENCRVCLVANGIRIIELEDPGSVYAYKQGGHIKYLNLKRMLTGLYSGGAIAKYDRIIKTRLDISLNYTAIIKRWVRSSKSFFSLNVSSNCPKRLLGYPYLFSISDWCFGFFTDSIELFNPELITESKLLREYPILIKDMMWYTKISAEQSLCILATNPDILYRIENKIKMSEYDIQTLEEHRKSMAEICNVQREGLGFKSFKYRAKGYRWLNYDTQDFSDDKIIKFKPFQFLVFVIVRLIQFFKREKSV